MSNQSRIDELTKELARILNVDSVDPDVALGELGVDSLIVVELLLACEQLYGLQVAPERLEIDQYTTLRDLDLQLAVGEAMAGEGVGP